MNPVSTKGRGWQGAVMKLMGADDYSFTVAATEPVTDHYVRLWFTGGGLLTAVAPHPTMWVRLWFADAGKLHQRGYTLVDPDPATDTFAVEFAIHDGTAARWAQQAQPGDTIAATLMGSKFAIPEPAPVGWLIAGDTASLPAVNSLLDAIGETSDAGATIWFEYQHESDKTLPLRAREQDTVHWISRERDGAALVDAVRSAAFDAHGHFGWVALDSVSTRAVCGVFKTDYGLPKKSLKSQAYWIVGKSFA
ncbi:siderophore-interacting protein [Gordonia sp. zg691]|uniref:Siderophore-interacting protein n=1 Tax=Gordonia jinghuaiqii TaxID=2758710 RepID=A0A7D7QGW6_9ACTN|nr:siderophore-interacting protein [Gordonia jinghuaiqii]MBD0863354.1 siderophore-interacting protein [Gordonia jinghuaiqii]MCR5980134.1 siderophore-interacting protein [Gordonia jinghuaiqii]QMT02102.1 siderophore-interacting protein [Gordonia jinghuaiqii]